MKQSASGSQRNFIMKKNQTRVKPFLDMAGINNLDKRRGTDLPVMREEKLPGFVDLYPGHESQRDLRCESPSDLPYMSNQDPLSP